MNGVFEGYASVFGAVDLGRDVVMAGAFTTSLARLGAGGVKLLWQHDPAQPVGIWTALYEDGRGLFCRGALNLDVQRGRELHALIRQGALNGLSIGFKTIRARKDASAGTRQLLAIDLWEISLVTFPLLPQARLSAVKAAPARFSMSPAADPHLERVRELFTRPPAQSGLSSKRMTI